LDDALTFSHVALPAPGICGGTDAMTVTNGGTVVVVAVENSMYAVAGTLHKSGNSASFVNNNALASSSQPINTQTLSSIFKIFSFLHPSPVYPVLAVDLADNSLEDDWSSLFLANGRECAVVDLYADVSLVYASGEANNSGSGTTVTTNTATILRCSKPRNGTVTVTSPILAAASCTWPWAVFLQSDALVSIRSPSCLSIPLRTVEIGQRPNDYFALRAVPSNASGTSSHGGSSKDIRKLSTPWVVAVAYSGECKILAVLPDSLQDMADRLMRCSIDAFGSNGFSRSELAEAVHASFTASSYVGPEPSPQARLLLKQYLEAVLGLSDFDGGGNSAWPFDFPEGDNQAGGRGSFTIGSDKQSAFGSNGNAIGAAPNSPPAVLSAN
jgi:Vam6/Vps39-like protein vacuolar protein sorting-associated protein 39